MNESIQQNKHPQNQIAKTFLYELPEAENPILHVPWNCVSDQQLYVLQLMQWGLWSPDPEMMNWRHRMRKNNDLRALEMKVCDLLEMSPKSAMHYLLSVENPDEEWNLGLDWKVQDANQASVELLNSLLLKMYENNELEYIAD